MITKKRKMTIKTLITFKIRCKMTTDTQNNYCTNRHKMITKTPKITAKTQETSTKRQN